MVLNCVLKMGWGDEKIILGQCFRVVIAQLAHDLGGRPPWFGLWYRESDTA